MHTLNLLISIISILISVAFYTILERKFLGYIQIRKGPNKVGFLGILQPFSDAIKLFNKNLTSLETMNFSLSYITPALALLISFLIIPIIPFNMFPLFDNKHNILSFLILSNISVYCILSIGWSSNSKYCYLGSIRSVAQMISYEISFFLIILSISFLISSYSLTQISEHQTMLWFIWGNMILFMMWTISCLAETNRSPFDFAEGESELVSGFNVEYMGGWFTLIFLAEYMSMLILSFFTISLFSKSYPFIIPITFLIIFSIILLWIRGTLPRFRYDLLMNMSWKIFLPLILLFVTLPLCFYSFNL